MNDLSKLVNETIADTAKILGFEVVKISFHNKGTKVLEILIDRLDQKPVNVDDCALFSKNISPILDIENVSNNKYFLQVSSAGIERELLKIEDYTRFIEKEVKIKLQKQLNNRHSYKGKIVKIDKDNNVVLEFDGTNVYIPFNIIKSANLLLTDEMFKNLLNK